jgi:hypothetical protein
MPFLVYVAPYFGLGVGAHSFRRADTIRKPIAGQPDVRIASKATLRERSSLWPFTENCSDDHGRLNNHASGFRKLPLGASCAVLP